MSDEGIKGRPHNNFPATPPPSSHGVAMRVARPFASLNKASAIAEMLVALGKRDIGHEPDLPLPLRLYSSAPENATPTDISAWRTTH